MEAGRDIASGLFVTRRYSSEMFDDVEESLDQIALAVQSEIAGALNLAVGFWRDDHLDVPHFQTVDKAVSIISSVGKERVRFNLSEQNVGLLDIGDIAGRQTDRQRIAQSIDHDMNFGGEPPS